MLRVGICDDEPLIIEALQRIILEIADTNGWEISISCFESGRALLEAVDTLEAVFLDIDMPYFTGMDIASYINERGLGTILVFVGSNIRKFL